MHQRPHQIRHGGPPDPRRSGLGEEFEPTRPSLAAWLEIRNVDWAMSAQHISPHARAASGSKTGSTEHPESQRIAVEPLANMSSSDRTQAVLSHQWAMMSNHTRAASGGSTVRLWPLHTKTTLPLALAAWLLVAAAAATSLLAAVPWSWWVLIAQVLFEAALGLVLFALLLFGALAAMAIAVYVIAPLALGTVALCVLLWPFLALIDLMT